MTTIGLIFPPDQPPEHLRDVALAVDSSGLEELWLWEDCFAESGIATAAAALAWTSRVRVGVGLLPVPLRSVALTAMELATLGRLFPGRFLPGIGHGVLGWMGQVGARAASPLTLLEEYGSALRRLLAGEEVTVEGRYVNLDAVRLQWRLDAASRVPLHVGATGPKTLRLAGTIGDGVIFTGATTPEQLADGMRIAREGFESAGREGVLEAITFASVPVGVDAAGVSDVVGPLVDAGASTVALTVLGEAGPPDPTVRIVDAVGPVAEVAQRLR